MFVKMFSFATFNTVKAPLHLVTLPDEVRPRTFASLKTHSKLLVIQTYQKNQQKPFPLEISRTGTYFSTRLLFKEEKFINSNVLTDTFRPLLIVLEFKIMAIKLRVEY